MKNKSSKILVKKIYPYLLGVLGASIVCMCAIFIALRITDGDKISSTKYTISGNIPNENTFYIGDYTPGIPYNDNVTGHVKPTYRALFITSWKLRYGIGLPDDEFEGQIITGYSKRLKGSIDFRKLTNVVSFGKPVEIVSNVLDEAFFGPTEQHFVLFYSPPESPIADGFYYVYSLSSEHTPQKLAAFPSKQFTLDVDARIEPIWGKYLVVSFGKTPHMNCWGNEKFILNIQTGKQKKLGEVVEIAKGARENEISYKRVIRRPSFQCSSGGYEFTLDHKIETELSRAYGNIEYLNLGELE